jgi:NAD(P)-dependent dehydrogenase (short-subunit alcohol dehydrogenase family)
MTNSDKGKVAFITGGNRGIGLETARELGRQGIAIVIGTRDLERGRTRTMASSTSSSTTPAC